MTSPTITFRVPPEAFAVAAERAAKLGLSVHKFACAAFLAHLEESPGQAASSPRSTDRVEHQLTELAGEVRKLHQSLGVAAEERLVKVRWEGLATVLAQILVNSLSQTDLTEDAYRTEVKRKIEFVRQHLLR